MSSQEIICPNCGTVIEVDREIQKKIESDIRQKYQGEYELKFDELSKERQKIEQFKANEKIIFEKELNKKLDEELKIRNENLQKQNAQYQSQLKAKIEAESKEQFNTMQKELAEKSQQLVELKKTQAEVERLKRINEEQRETIKLESEKELNTRLNEERKKIVEREREKHELVKKEQEKKLADQAKNLEEMQRKLEQGSVQLQGEVQELAIEEWLAQEFPLDTIEEIKKGARGADCIQTINTRESLNCGKIYYESKRTENFSPAWVEKFKQDMREKSINIGVLVTKSMPKDMPSAGLLDGIWVCSFTELKTVSKVLRDGIIRVHQVAGTQVNKNDKMQMLYDYLTGDNFRMQLGAIVEGFEKMKSEIDREKRAMHKIWKERETQLDKVILSTIDMYGSLKGIAGNSIHTINSLELDAGNDASDEDIQI